jgi:hypothetical protein
MNSFTYDLVEFMADPENLLPNRVGFSPIGEIAGSADFNLNVAVEPSLPIRVVTSFELLPSPNLQTLDPAVKPAMQPRAQIRVRSDDYVLGWNKIKEIHDMLYILPSFDYNDTRYVHISIDNGPHNFRRDENDHHMFTLNLSCIREEI